MGADEIMNMKKFLNKNTKADKEIFFEKMLEKHHIDCEDEIEAFLKKYKDNYFEDEMNEKISADKDSLLQFKKATEEMIEQENFVLELKEECEEIKKKHQSHQET